MYSKAWNEKNVKKNEKGMRKEKEELSKEEGRNILQVQSISLELFLREKCNSSHLQDHVTYQNRQSIQLK